jgi:hypothetical protein
MKKMKTRTMTVGSGCVLIAALVASGCDERPTMEQADMGQGLVDQEEIVNDIASEGAVYGEVATESAVGVVLEGMQDNDEMTGKSLEWTVYNALDEDIRVVPTLRCEGLAILERKQELATLEIGPKGSAAITLAADALPIQSALGAGTIQLEFAVSTAKNPERTVPVLSPMWYYRHSGDYQTLEVFTEEVLMEKHGGVVFDIPAGIQAKNGVIGRVLEGGEAEDVTALDSEMTVGDAASGEYRVTGISMDPGEADSEVESEPPALDFDILLLVNWCARWSGATYTDQIGAPPPWIVAKYTHGRLVDLDDDDNIVWSGVLDGNGCKQIWTKSNNNYQFKLGTQLTREGRIIYVQPSTEEQCVPNQLWHNTNVTTGTLFSGQTITVTRSASTAQARTAVVAQQPLIYYSTREWPSAVTYIRPKPDTTPYCSYTLNTSCWAPGEAGCGDGGGRIHIATSFENPDLPGTYIDHSTYRFIVSHEMGHRQAWATYGPMCEAPAGCLSGVQYQTDTPHPCNCELFSSYKGGCYQSRGYPSNKHQEAWAYFYGAALFNSQGTVENPGTCAWKYWRGMYDSTLPLADNPDWITPGPVQVDCGVNVKWMEKYCNAANRGVTQDWMAFYWNLWTNGTYRYSINEITDVWEATDAANNELGETWAELSLELFSLFPGPGNIPKINHFLSTGDAAGVDH